MTDKAELIQGPVLKWEPTPEDQVFIDELLASDDELNRAYGEAYKARCFIKEFGGSDDEHGIAAVGEMDTIASVAFRLGKDVNELIDGLTIADCFNLSTHPGQGATRAERVLNGLRAVQESREKAKNLEVLDLHRSFTVDSYRIDAFMPRNSSQPQQWTLKLYKAGEDTPLRVETIPMLHEPIFGVDVDDIEALERRVGGIISELYGGPAKL